MNEENIQLAITLDQALELGAKLDINWGEYSLFEFLQGYGVELEHGVKFPRWNVTNNDPIMTAKIVMAHLEELPDYYTRLNKMENG